MEKEILFSVCDIIKNFSKDLVIKCFGVVGFLLYSLAFGDTQHKILIALTVLVIVRFFSGITSAWYSGERIEMVHCFRSATRWFWYMMMILSVHQIGIIIPFADFYTVSTMTGFLACTEVIGIMHHMAKLGIAVPSKLLNLIETKTQ